MAPLSKDEVLASFRMEFDEAKYHEIRDLWKHHSINEDNRNVEGILTTLSADCRYEIVNTALVWVGKAGAAQFYKELLTAIPDAKFTLQHIAIGPQGVFEEAILTGHHKGDFRSFPATQQKIESIVGIFFPWNGKAKLFSGERIYAEVAKIFAS